MNKVLYVESSPRKERSASIMVAKEFLRQYRAVHTSDTVETLDLWSEKLPAFDGDIINAKYRILHGQPHTPAESRAWEAVVEVFKRFTSADKYLFSVPMWNFGIPYRLKHFIDVITQPGLAFSFSPESGFQGLVVGKPVAVVYARGGEYTADAKAKALDYQKSYFETWLSFIGFQDIRSVVIEPTLGAPDAVEQVKAAARELAGKMATSF